MKMLSAEELLSHRKKDIPEVYSMGSKKLTLQRDEQEAFQLNRKLENMEELLRMERVKLYGSMAQAVWLPDLKKAEVIKKVGGFWDIKGHSENSKYYLYPEEALYLLSVGALEITFCGVPLSLQRAYTLLLHNTGVSLKQYKVYSYLSLLGYNLQRHSKKRMLTKYEKEIELHKGGLKLKDLYKEGASPKKKKCETDDNSINVAKEMATLCGFNRNADETQNETLSRLRVIPAATFEDLELDLDKLFDYDAYLETAKKGGIFRKSVLKLPTYRIRIVSVDEPAPDIRTTVKLHEHCEDEVPIIYAVVHPDFIHFMQVAPVSLPVLL